MSTTSIPATTSTVSDAPPPPKFELFSDTAATVLIPSGEPPFPAVVMVHGGGFVSGSPESMAALAQLLRDEGFLVLNTAYHLATTSSPAFPTSVHDVACAVRIAADHDLSDGSVAAVGVSAGAHLTTLVALTGDQYGAPCPVLEKTVPDRLVALGIPDVSLGGLSEQWLFGSSPEEDPQRWAAGDPLEHTDANPALSALFVHAADDSVVPKRMAVEMVELLNQAGASADLVEIPDIGHFDLSDPALIGSAIIDWLNS